MNSLISFCFSFRYSHFRYCLLGLDKRQACRNRAGLGGCSLPTPQICAKLDLLQIEKIVNSQNIVKYYELFAKGFLLLFPTSLLTSTMHKKNFYPYRVFFFIFFIFFSFYCDDYQFQKIIFHKTRSPTLGL